jgi:hypothetical protein
MPDLIFGILGLIVGWFLLPTLYLDTPNLEAAKQSLNGYEAQLTWLRLLYTLPLSLFGLVWKSYLGGLGAHFGTKTKCTLRSGFLVFFGLGLLGLLISFVL